MTRRDRVPSRIGDVDLVHWNPRRRHLPRPLGRVRFGRRTDNFGDLLGPLVVQAVLRSRGQSYTFTDGQDRHGRLLSVGSILHAARPGDVVWGTGVNGKNADTPLPTRLLDVRAVRGPLTARLLRDAGVKVPDVMGDPGILVRRLFPELESVEPIAGTVTGVPNLHDLPAWRGVRGLDLVAPQGEPFEVIRNILQGERVVTSSLHALVIADVFGRPAVLVRAGQEPSFKYEDYARGIDRRVPVMAATPDEGMARVPSAEPAEVAPATVDHLLAAFPWDLWGGVA